MSEEKICTYCTYFFYTRITCVYYNVLTLRIFQAWVLYEILFCKVLYLFFTLPKLNKVLLV